VSHNLPEPGGFVFYKSLIKPETGVDLVKRTAGVSQFVGAVLVLRERGCLFKELTIKMNLIKAPGPSNLGDTELFLGLRWRQFITHLSPFGSIQQVQNTTTCHNLFTMHLILN